MLPVAVLMFMPVPAVKLKTPALLNVIDGLRALNWPPPARPVPGTTVNNVGT